MFSHFSGRVIQVAEILDAADAVSQNILALQRLFRERFGLRCEIYSQFCHDAVAAQRRPLDELRVDQRDIVFLHFSGEAPNAVPHLVNTRCTKVLVYHNITPAEFFREGTHLHDHCRNGRAQLREIVDRFDYHIADSSYNLGELHALGVAPARSRVVPIVVPEPPRANSEPQRAARGGGATWLYVGRIAPNKQQHRLVEVFAQHLRDHGAQHRLVLVGKYDESDWYYRQLVECVRDLHLSQHVTITGGVDDAELDRAYRNADVFVSVSEHEGFGVPLVEAFHHQLPVVALARGAVPETLGESPALVDRADQVPDAAHRLLTDPDFRRNTLDHQEQQKERSSADAVAARLREVLSLLIPAPSRYRHSSVVICTYNRADLLDRCLDYLRFQVNPDFEVVVVNGPSTDHTDEVLEKYKGKIKVGRTDQRNLSVARNIGIELASGDIVAFLDDDAIAYDDWVDLLLHHYNRLPLAVGGIGGTTFLSGGFEFQNSDLGVNTTADVEISPHSQLFGDPDWYRYLHGTNASFARDALIECGGFDEQYDYFLDEADLCFRLQADHRRLVHFERNLYVRHEFAKSENRTGRYDYNWFAISKNTAYFVLKSNTRATATQNRRIVEQKLRRERIDPLRSAFEGGEITKQRMDAFVAEVERGQQQGLKDATSPRKLRRLTPTSDPFLRFPTRDDFPRVGTEIGRLHVAIVTREFPPFATGGGVGTLYSNLAQELLQMGHFVTVVVPGDAADVYARGRFRLHRTPIRDLLRGIDEFPVLKKNLDWSCSAASEILRIHRESPIDLIDSALWDVEAYALAAIKEQHAIPLLIRLVTPVEVASTINGWPLGHAELALLTRTEADLIRQADAVVPISESIAATVEQVHGLRRGDRWYRNTIGVRYWPAFDVERDYESMDEHRLELGDVAPGTLKVLFLGRLEPRKGIDLFVEVAERMLKESEGLVFVAAGDDPEGWCEKVPERLSAASRRRFVFLGHVDDATKEKLLNWADLLVFPSRYESFGLVPLEAFVHGTPVIASRSGAIPEVVEDGESGLLFDDVEGLYLAIERVRDERGLLEKLQTGAKERVRRLNSRRMSVEAVQIYSRVLARAAC